MKHKTVAVVATAMLSVISSASAAVITGKVIDSSTDEPMEFVNVTVSDKSSGKELPVGTMSDINGAFKLNNLPQGRYNVKLSYVGYKAASVDAEIHSANQSLNLNVVGLSENTHVLDEIEVVGMKSQMRFELDKKVFNVDQNIAAAGASASEILETIPSVEVDDDGEVSLRGNSSVTIWINGRPSGLTADNRGQILEQLPAETIEKIEVITNPSAKYSPEGTSGIINIVLKQNRQPGYFGGAQVGANTQGGYNAGGNINFNIGKWDAYANVGLRPMSGCAVGTARVSITRIALITTALILTRLPTASGVTRRYFSVPGPLIISPRPMLCRWAVSEWLEVAGTTAAPTMKAQFPAISLRDLATAAVTIMAGAVTCRSTIPMNSAIRIT